MKCKYCTRVLKEGETCCTQEDMVIKDECVKCGRTMPHTEKRYLVQGNYCIHCTARCMDLALATSFNSERAGCFFRKLLTDKGFDMHDRS